jgi:hypothetical protein
MNQASPNIIVMSFNDFITRRDIDGLSKLMTDNHVFIDAANNTISGKLFWRFSGLSEPLQARVVGGKRSRHHRALGLLRYSFGRACIVDREDRGRADR